MSRSSRLTVAGAAATATPTDKSRDSVGTPAVGARTPAVFGLASPVIWAVRHARIRARIGGFVAAGDGAKDVVVGTAAVAGIGAVVGAKTGTTGVTGAISHDKILFREYIHFYTKWEIHNNRCKGKSGTSNQETRREHNPGKHFKRMARPPETIRRPKYRIIGIVSGLARTAERPQRFFHKLYSVHKQNIIQYTRYQSFFSC